MMTKPETRSEEQPLSLRLLLTCGAVAGPLFTIGWIAAGATRADYDPLRYPISSLSIGELGWMQIANFLATGSLLLAFAAGLRRVLGRPSGTVWGPVLVGLVGIGLVGAGLFVTDPLNGYPPGTPLLPTERTTHGILHDLFGIPFFLGLPITCLVFARFFTRQGEANWARYSLLNGIGMLGVFIVARLGFRLLPGYPDLAAKFGLLQRITVTIGLAWLAFLAIHFLRGNAARR